MNFYITTSFICYITVIFIISIYFYTKVKNIQDFAVGDRSINYWVTAIGAQASDMGSWLFFGLPSAVYLNGLCEIWTAIGLLIGMFLNWHYIAPRLRVKTGVLKNLTLTSFFSTQFNDKKGYIQLVSAFICIVFFIFYIASGLVGLGRVFESAFQIDYHYSIVLAIATTCLYSLLGGFSAVAWSNLFQGIFLLIMIVIVPTYAFFTLPCGFTSITHAAHIKHVSLSIIDSAYNIPSIIILALSWGLGYFGQPHILVYFMGIDNAKNIVYAKYVGMTWQLIALSSALLSGLIGLAFFTHHPQPVELLFISMTKALFHPLILGFVLCAIFAAILTTMNTHILISGSVFTQDIYLPLNNNTLSSKKLLFVSRMSSLSIALFALLIAWHNNSSIYNLVNYAWSGLGSAFGPLVIAACYVHRVSHDAALYGMITGALVSAIWPYYNVSLMPLIPGFISNCVIMGICQYIDTYKKSS